MIRVLICDDHLIVREGIKQILAEADDLRVVGEAANGADALRGVRASREAGLGPDVVLLDLEMPVMGGLEALARIRALQAQLGVAPSAVVACSTFHSWCVPVTVAAAPDFVVVPKPPRMTLTRDRFIALHMMYERIAPLDPTSAPVAIRSWLLRVNPVADAAQPE